MRHTLEMDENDIKEALSKHYGLLPADVLLIVDPGGTSSMVKAIISSDKPVLEVLHARPAGRASDPGDGYIPVSELEVARRGVFADALDGVVGVLYPDEPIESAWKKVMTFGGVAEAVDARLRIMIASGAETRHG